MCTLIVLDRVVLGWPLVVASNRDEFYARPAAVPVLVQPEEESLPAFVAPRDLEAGGTWMGLNRTGLFVGLTNRRTPGSRRDGRSRGLLVQDALGRATALDVAQMMNEDLENTYNPFHIFYGDGRESFLTFLRDEGAETAAIAPGIQVLGNCDPDDPDSDKVRRIREEVGIIDLEAPLETIFSRLAEVLRGHSGGNGPLDHACVHTPTYGTRSSALLTAGGERWRYWHAEGPPCEAKYTDYTRLLDEFQYD